MDQTTLSTLASIVTVLGFPVAVVAFLMAVRQLRQAKCAAASATLPELWRKYYEEFYLPITSDAALRDCMICGCHSDARIHADGERIAIKFLFLTECAHLSYELGVISKKSLNLFCDRCEKDMQQYNMLRLKRKEIDNTRNGDVCSDEGASDEHNRVAAAEYH